MNKITDGLEKKTLYQSAFQLLMNTNYSYYIDILKYNHINAMDKAFNNVRDAELIVHDLQLRRAQ